MKCSQWKRRASRCALCSFILVSQLFLNHAYGEVDFKQGDVSRHVYGTTSGFTFTLGDNDVVASPAIEDANELILLERFQLYAGGSGWNQNIEPSRMVIFEDAGRNYEVGRSNNFLQLDETLVRGDAYTYNFDGLILEKAKEYYVYFEQADSTLTTSRQLLNRGVIGGSTFLNFNGDKLAIDSSPLYLARGTILTPREAIYSTEDGPTGIGNASGFAFQLDGLDVQDAFEGTVFLNDVNLVAGAATNSSVQLRLFETTDNGWQEVARSRNRVDLSQATADDPRQFTFTRGTQLEVGRNYLGHFFDLRGNKVAVRVDLNILANPSAWFIDLNGNKVVSHLSPKMSFAVSQAENGIERLMPRPGAGREALAVGGMRITLGNDFSHISRYAMPESGEDFALDSVALLAGGIAHQAGSPVKLEIYGGSDGTELIASSENHQPVGGQSLLEINTPIQFDFTGSPRLRRDQAYQLYFVDTDGERTAVELLVSGSDGGGSVLTDTAGEVIAGEKNTPLVVLNGDFVPLNLTASSMVDFAGSTNRCYVVALAGQSNMVGYGEHLADMSQPIHQPVPRVLQVGRGIDNGDDRMMLKAADPSLDHAQNMRGRSASERTNHVLVRSGQKSWQDYGGTVGAGMYIGKGLLTNTPDDVCVLLVPAARGGASFSYGSDSRYLPGETLLNTWSQSWMKWGVTGGYPGNEGGKTGLYLDMLERIKWALDQNPNNILLAVVWGQGESDLGDPASHKYKFEEQVRVLAEDLSLAGYGNQCLTGDCSAVPWVAGDTTTYWKRSGYNEIYHNTYGQSALPQVSFVEYMYLDDGKTIAAGTNADDVYHAATNPDGADGRTSSVRTSHFSSEANVETLAPRLAEGVLQAVNAAY